MVVPVSARRATPKMRSSPMASVPSNVGAAAETMRCTSALSRSGCSRGSSYCGSCNITRPARSTATMMPPNLALASVAMRLIHARSMPKPTTISRFSRSSNMGSVATIIGRLLTWPMMTSLTLTLRRLSAAWKYSRLLMSKACGCSMLPQTPRPARSTTKIEVIQGRLSWMLRSVALHSVVTWRTAGTWRRISRS